MRGMWRNTECRWAIQWKKEMYLQAPLFPPGDYESLYVDHRPIKEKNSATNRLPKVDLTVFWFSFLDLMEDYQVQFVWAKHNRICNLSFLSHPVFQAHFQQYFITDSRSSFKISKYSSTNPFYTKISSEESHDIRPLHSHVAANWENFDGIDLIITMV